MSPILMILPLECGDGLHACGVNGLHYSGARQGPKCQIPAGHVQHDSLSPHPTHHLMARIFAK